MAPESPLPTASNRAALTNRLALLAASQSSLLQTMNLNPSSSSSSSRRARRQPDPEEEEDSVGAGGDEFAGVGFVRQGAKDKDSSGREDEALRGRILGRKRKGMVDNAAAGGWGMKKKKKEESSEDEEEGRGSLGKRKRPRTARNEDELDADVKDSGEAQQQKGNEVGDSTTENMENTADDATVSQAHQTTGESAPKKKKKKKKNKKKHNEAA